MIIGQPGSGKSTLARILGDLTQLPVVHMDHIHWQSGWVERSGAEKDSLCADVHVKPRWIFEGGRSVTWPQRLARADTVIWLDFSISIRALRVFRRTLRYWGQNRPDLPEGCPEQFSWAFVLWIWRTRRSGRVMMARFFATVPPKKAKICLRNVVDVRSYVSGLRP